MSKKPTEDEEVFGKGQFVYCASHVNYHPTGWCTVPVSEKVGLGIEATQKNQDEAAKKCRRLGLELLKDTKT